MTRVACGQVLRAHKADADAADEEDRAHMADVLLACGALLDVLGV